MMLASFGESLLAFFIIFLSLILIGLVLLQKNKGGGLSGAFGGVGGYSAFGTKTGDFLTWVTVGVTAAFLLACVAGNWVFSPSAVAATPGATTPAPNRPGQPTPRPAPGGARPPAGPVSTKIPLKPGPGANKPTAGITNPGTAKPVPPTATPPPSTQPGN